MKLRTMAVGIVVVGLAALFGRDVCADPMEGKIYGRVGGGGLVLNDIDFASTASVNGITVTANGSFSFSPGVALTGAVGYRYNQWLAFEGELGYGTASYDSVSGNFTASVSGHSVTVSGSASVDGDVRMVSGLANLVVTPLGRDTFEPYLGGGLGFVNIKDTVDSVAGDTSVTASETATDFAMDFLVGFDYAVKESISVGGQYRYFWADSGSNGVDDATAHIFLVTGKFAF